MTAHTHTTRVPGCYRCELGIDEAMDALADERDELEAERDLYREALELIAEAEQGYPWFNATARSALSRPSASEEAS